MAAGLRDFDAGQDWHARYQERLGMLVMLCAHTDTAPTCRGRVVRVGEKPSPATAGEDLRQLAEIGIVASPASSTGAGILAILGYTAGDA